MEFYYIKEYCVRGDFLEWIDKNDFIVFFMNEKIYKFVNE